MVTTNYAVDFLNNKLDWERVPVYQSYFDSIRPKTEADVFRRGLFAISSVHTTWELNCELYAQLWDYEKWLNDPKVLRRKIEDSRAGLTNNRFKYFSAFAKKYWEDPSQYLKKDNETWQQYRKRVEDMTPGLGVAKSAFFVELVYFHDTDVVCADTHLLQMGGYTTREISKKGVKAMDVLIAANTWSDLCKQFNVNPVTARWMHWDMKQGKQDSRYWSHVLEQKPSTRTQPQMWLFPEFA